MFANPKIKHKIDQAIEQAYACALVRAESIDPVVADLIIVMRDFILRGGKRIRPLLAYNIYSYLHGEDEESIVKVGAALEIFHNFLLIHDDVIDRDLLRYGGKNIEGVYRDIFYEKNAQIPEHKALSAALLAGDITTNISRNLVYDLPITDIQKLAILRAIDDAIFIVGGGEFVDSLGYDLSSVNLQVDQILSMYAHKTAYYSFSLPFTLGAIMANASTETHALLQSLATPLGVAFQIRDDYIGLFGDPVLTGKSVTTDIQEGRETIYIALLREKLNDGELFSLSKHHGNPHAGPNELDWIKAMCIEKGVVKEVDRQIATLCESANRAVSNLPFDLGAKKELTELIRFCTERNV